MDIRIQKTLRNIQQVFLTLRTDMPLDKIRVNDLCIRAKINKSTFYRYYTNIFDLSDKTENKIVEKIICDFSSIDCLFTEPERFISGLLSSIDHYRQEIEIVFHDRINVFNGKMEARLKSHYLTAKSTPEEDIVMSYVIGGAAHVLLNQRYDIHTATSTLSMLLRQTKEARIKMRFND
jgi:AcrR family transcriptional regulator